MSSEFNLALPNGVQITRVGMILPVGLAPQDYEVIGQRLVGLREASRWALLDWLNYGERYGLKSRAAESLDMSAETLRNMCSVARRIEPSRRRDGLTFGHHECVASLTPEQQTRWLIEADEVGYTVQDLRGAIRLWKEGADRERRLIEQEAQEEARPVHTAPERPAVSSMEVEETAPPPDPEMFSPPVGARSTGPSRPLPLPRSTPPTPEAAPANLRSSVATHPVSPLASSKTVARPAETVARPADPGRIALRWTHRATYTYHDGKGVEHTHSFEIVEVPTDTGVRYDLYSRGTIFDNKPSLSQAMKRAEEHVAESVAAGKVGGKVGGKGGAK